MRPHPWDSQGKNTGVGCYFLLQCIKVKSESEVAQSCPTLRDPMDCSLPGFSVHGIFQARVLEWGAIAFSIKCPIQRQRPTFLWKWKSLSSVWLFATPRTIQSMEFSRPEYGVGSLSLFQGIFPTQGSNPRLLHCRRILYQLSYIQGKPKNTGVGSQSLLQGIFPTQKWNWGLLHYRWILYELSYEGSPTYSYRNI